MADRDYVKEAYETFIKNAEGLDPSDPVAAVGSYFEKNATDDLKARCKAEGKDAEGCWEFIEAVAREALHGSDGHIDPGAVYAIAMHWFEDVPVDWDKGRKSGAQQTIEEAAEKGRAEALAKLEEQRKKPKKPKKAKKEKKPKKQQGFFFDVLMQPDAQKPCGAPSPQESPVAPAEETAMESSSEAGISTTESEVQ